MIFKRILVVLSTLVILSLEGDSGNKRNNYNSFNVYIYRSWL